MNDNLVNVAIDAILGRESTRHAAPRLWIYVTAHSPLGACASNGFGLFISISNRKQTSYRCIACLVVTVFG